MNCESLIWLCEKCGCCEGTATWDGAVRTSSPPCYHYTWICDKCGNQEHKYLRQQYGREVRTVWPSAVR